MKIRIALLILISIFLGSCVTQYVRLPSSSGQVYSNVDVQQSLMMLAQNNILVYIPEATTREFEKTEVDQKCQLASEPLWSEKMTTYINDLRRHPEYLSRIHAIELVRADASAVKVQKDLDGATILSIQFNKYESHGKITLQSKLPCNASLAEYIGQDLIKTRYDFPDADDLFSVLSQLPEKKVIPRFTFANDFLMYLAERGTIYKYTHDASFEKTAQGAYVMPQLLNKLAEEVKQPFHQHLNYWFKQIHQESTQAKVLQMFGFLQDPDLKVGVMVDSLNGNESKAIGEADVTYLYLGYSVESDQIKFANLKQLDQCLKNLTDAMSIMSLRKPASTEKQSYLRPGYSCQN